MGCRQFYALPSIAERMARSRTGLWWNIVRNLGYHLALRNFGDVGFNPEGQAGMTEERRSKSPQTNNSLYSQ